MFVVYVDYVPNENQRAEKEEDGERDGLVKLDMTPDSSLPALDTCSRKWGSMTLC